VILARRAGQVNSTGSLPSAYRRLAVLLTLFGDDPGLGTYTVT
jgi:hypothetical protein